MTGSRLVPMSSIMGCERSTSDESGLVGKALVKDCSFGRCCYADLIIHLPLRDTYVTLGGLHEPDYGLKKNSTTSPSQIS